MTDTERIDFLEKHKGQAWHDRKSGQWTVFVVIHGELPIQPTKPALREAIDEAQTLVKRIK